MHLNFNILPKKYHKRQKTTILFYQHSFQTLEELFNVQSNTATVRWCGKMLVRRLMSWRTTTSASTSSPPSSSSSLSSTTSCRVSSCSLTTSTRSTSFSTTFASILVITSPSTTSISSITSPTSSIVRITIAVPVVVPMGAIWICEASSSAAPTHKCHSHHSWVGFRCDLLNLEIHSVDGGTSCFQKLLS